MTATEGFIAANRFGLGARPGELWAISRDPRAWVSSQISMPHQIPAPLSAMPPSSETIRKIHEVRIEGQDAIRAAMRSTFRPLMIKELHARTMAMVQSEHSFRERMVAFWSNHFTVSATRFTVGPLIGGYEREAIRPHIFGSFEDMLVAVARHPVMLSYLDNARSTGPRSIAGQRRGVGLNENLAREILELHTLGVNGGYSQNDVTEFAKVLTGWSHGGLRNKNSIQFLGPVHGKFEYHDRRHEPGDKMILGKTYREDGAQEGIDVLADLAKHPSTARFIATKLVRHFVNDTPPPAAIAQIEQAYLRSDGNLAAVSRELIRLEEIWLQPLTKVKTPYELVVSMLRAVDLQDVPERSLAGSLRQLGHFPFRASSPAGWPDRAKDWLSPESLLRRIEWVRAATARFPRSLQPDDIAEVTIGPVMTAPTKEMIDAAPSGEEALAMIFASAEFQRR